MARVKFVAVSRGVKEIMEYVQNKEKTMDRLIAGVNKAKRIFESVKLDFV